MRIWNLDCVLYCAGLGQVSRFPKMTVSILYLCPLIVYWLLFMASPIHLSFGRSWNNYFFSIVIAAYSMTHLKSTNTKQGMSFLYVCCTCFYSSPREGHQSGG